MVILTLWDFYIYEIPARLELFKNTQKLDSYINNCLIPLIRGVNHHRNLIAWEIINEPEWIIENAHAITWQ